MIRNALTGEPSSEPETAVPQQQESTAEAALPAAEPVGIVVTVPAVPAAPLAS